MNRVYCLYRVSTAQQLKENDIPMQRKACREFAQAHGWEIIKELYEKGISGFKTPVGNRKNLQQIKKDAELGKFDILLVFMFDRLGRRESETPFFVENLAYRGIEIWSVKEGQQRFDTHADKLINFIHYWIAEGESEKISERIKTRKRQLTQEGLYTGGVCPYGYRLVYNGRRNGKGYEIHDLEVDEEEATVVRRIFQYYNEYGYGPRKISTTLSTEGVFARNGEPFHYSSIHAMLSRRLFTGVYCSGGVSSAVIPELQIITPEVFDRAQHIMELKRQGEAPIRTSAYTLLTGSVFCGHCGGRLYASSCKSKNGSQHIGIYRCYNRAQHKACCSGQSTYRAKMIDTIVLERLGQFCTKHTEYRTIYRKFLSSELPVRKMLLSQWVRVVVFSYDRIEMGFCELE